MTTPSTPSTPSRSVASQTTPSTAHLDDLHYGPSRSLNPDLTTPENMVVGGTSFHQNDASSPLGANGPRIEQRPFSRNRLRTAPGIPDSPVLDATPSSVRQPHRPRSPLFNMAVQVNEAVYAAARSIFSSGSPTAYGPPDPAEGEHGPPSTPSSPSDPTTMATIPPDLEHHASDDQVPSLTPTDEGTSPPVPMRVDAQAPPRRRLPLLDVDKDVPEDKDVHTPPAIHMRVSKNRPSL